MTTSLVPSTATPVRASRHRTGALDVHRLHLQQLRYALRPRAAAADSKRGDRTAPAVAGELDPTFGDDGRVVFHPPAEPTAVAVQPDGRVVVAGSSEGVAWAARFTADGRVDPSFGVGGTVTIGPGSVAAVAVQPDGRVVLAGNYAGDFAAFRLTADGTLDTTFGTGGRVGVSFDTDGPMVDSAVAVAVLPDARIVLGGSTRTPPAPFIEASYLWSGSFGAARLTADGQLDPTFGDGGTATAAVPVGDSDAAMATAMVVQPDGRVVLAGSTVSGRIRIGSIHVPFVNTTDFAAVRLTAAGRLDPEFGDGGRVRVPFDLGGPNFSDGAKAVGVRADGTVVLAGTANTPDALWDVVARLTPDGRLDPSYDGDGKAGVPSHSSAPTEAAVLPDGRVVFAGGELVRLTTDGQPDPTFGDDGRALTPGPTNLGSALVPQGLAVQPDGDILLTGPVPLQTDGVLARILGSPSPTARCGAGSGWR